MASEKTKLRPLIHKSYTYLLEKFHLQTEPGFAVEAQSLQKMVEDVKKAVYSIYPGGASFNLEFALNDVSYILNRFIEAGEGRTHIPPGDIYAMADALDLRFEKLVTMLEELDAQP